MQTKSDTVAKKSTVSKYEFGLNFLLGGVAAAIGKTAAAPAERIKLLLQNQNELIKQGKLSTPYKGIADCFFRVVREENFIALWRGNLPNVLRYFPTQALNFAFRDFFKAHLPVVDRKQHPMKFFAANIGTGALAGSSALLFVYPLDYGRTRLASDVKNSREGKPRQFNGLMDVYRKTLKHDGPRGLYRGAMISLVGTGLYRGIYFGMYDTFKPLVLNAEKGTENSFWAAFLLGWSVTVGAGYLIYPIDTVQRRMMMTSAEAVKYRGTTDAFKTILKKEGARALYKGAGANVLRSIAGAGTLAGYDKLKQMYFPKKNLIRANNICTLNNKQSVQ